MFDKLQFVDFFAELIGWNGNDKLKLVGHS